MTPKKRTTTSDGEEQQWAVNVLAYHRLLKALLPQLRLAAGQGRPRVVFVASFYAGGLDLSDVEFARRPYSAGDAYRASKQANRQLARAWAQRLAPDGIDVTSCHPGIATSKVSLGLGFDMDRSKEAARRGADTPLHCCLADKLKSGAFYANCREARCEFAADIERLWTVVEAAGG